MSIELLVQISGGLFGLGIAYVIYRVDERKYELINAKQRAKHLAEMEEIRKQKLTELNKQKEAMLKR